MSRSVVRIVALVVLAAGLTQAPSSAAPPPVPEPSSELRIGGRLVAYVNWSRATNTFHIGDAYPDERSAVVRYRLGSAKKTYHRWNSEGNGSIEQRTIVAGALPVHFKACRAARAERNFQCAKRWVTVGSSCLKAGWTKAWHTKGTCLTATGEVLFGDAPYSGWAYRLRGMISDPTFNGKPAKLQARTHLSGEDWSKPTTMARITSGRATRYDQVLYRGGRRFFYAFRICGNGCTTWSVGDGAVGM